MNHNEYKALCQKAREIIEFYESHVEFEDDIYYGNDNNVILSEDRRDSIAFERVQDIFPDDSRVIDELVFASRKPLRPEHEKALEIAVEILWHSDPLNIRQDAIDFIMSIEIPQENFIKITPDLILKKKAEWLSSNKDFLEKNKKEVAEFKLKQEEKRYDDKLKESKEKKEKDNIEALEKQDDLINNKILFFVFGAISGIIVSSLF